MMAISPSRPVSSPVPESGTTVTDQPSGRLLLITARCTSAKLQRLFNEYVGVSPKWVINRYRLHEAVAILAQDQSIDWAQLAADLGYFDQAHFIRDFKSVTGRTPTEYVTGIG